LAYQGEKDGLIREAIGAETRIEFPDGNLNVGHDIL
jgi:hypothetical protein